MEYIVTVGLIVMVIAWIFGIITLKKQLDTTIAIIYGIYGLKIIISWIFVLIGLKQGWLEV